jgi:general secretion pathway protein N
MANRSAWLGLAAGAYLAATIALFPAATAYRWLAPAGIRAAGIEGSIWRGRAALVAIADVGLYDIEWSTSPWRLLTGRLVLVLQARMPDGFLRGHVNAAPGSVEITDLQLSSTLTFAGRFIPLGDVRGLVSVQLETLELRDGWPTRVVGDVRLAQLQAPLLMPGGPSGLVPLGNYLVTLTDTGSNQLGGEFVDQGGPLEVSGTFSVDETRAYELRGLTRPRDDAPQELVNGLAFVTAPPDPNGYRAFELTGSL